MRTITFLSPSSIKEFKADRVSFYRKYLADVKFREPQTPAMAVGGAFDAYVKYNLVKDLFGEVEADRDRFHYARVIQNQVSANLVPWALEHGLKIFEAYKASGAYHEIKAALDQSPQAPRFEFTAASSDGVAGRFEGVPLLGKPDLSFQTADGVDVTLDWKVNGYCSNSPVSPKPGYLRVRDTWDSLVAPASKNNFMCHKRFHPAKQGNVLYNEICPLEDTDPDWALQLAIYGWLSGFEVGSKFICMIDQIHKASGGLRVASFSAHIGKDFQLRLLADIKKIWETVQSGHIFSDLPRDASDAYCLQLDKGLAAEDDPNNAWFDSMTGKGWK